MLDVIKFTSMESTDNFVEPTYYAHAKQIQTFRAKNDEYAGYGETGHNYGKGLMESKGIYVNKNDNGCGKGRACEQFRID